MQFIKENMKDLFLFFIGVLLLFLRSLWEFRSPVNPDDFKGILYYRDILILFPAGMMLGYLLLKKTGFILKNRNFLNWIQNRWLLLTVSMALLSFCFCSFINMEIYKTCAHIVDEANYLFQAKIFAAGRLTAPPAPLSEDFFHLLYFIQSPDKWYSSFFPGQSALLAVGVIARSAFLVNPFLTAVLLLVTVWAGRRLYSLSAGIIAGFLLLCSPFVLFQGASYFSHIFPAVLITVILVWSLEKERLSAGKLFACGLLTGIVIFFRPMSALVIMLFFLFYYGNQILRSKVISVQRGITYSIMFIVGFLPGMILMLVYNYTLTGHYFTTPHELALPNETLGLGIHSLKNSVINITGLSVDLLGLPLLSLIPVILFFLSRCRYARPILIFSIMYGIAYSLYPYHGLSYGPRFYFELVPILLIGSSQVLLYKGPFFVKRLNTVFNSVSQKAVIITLITAVPIISFLGILPARISVFASRGEYYHIEDTVRKEITLPAVVSIKDSEKERIIPYIAGFQLNSPTWDGDIVYVRYVPGRKQELMRAYPERQYYILDMKKKIVYLDT